MAGKLLNGLFIYVFIKYYLLRLYKLGPSPSLAEFFDIWSGMPVAKKDTLNTTP